MTGSESTPARRHVLKGAAWAAPVALAATAAPAIAASFERTYTAPRPALTSAQASDTTWTVPTGVTRVRVQVEGAGGGGIDQSQGGAGARVSGEIAVTPGQPLRLIVGAGGSRQRTSATAIVGGGGYGKGGDSPAFPSTGTTNRSRGGSGGGASAILLGNTPVIVAGGGGGGGGSATSGAFTGMQARGGNALASGSDGTATANDSTTNVLARGGRAGTNGTAGTGGPAGTVAVASGTTENARNLVVGNSGGAGFNAAGGNGVQSAMNRPGFVRGSQVPRRRVPVRGGCDGRCPRARRAGSCRSRREVAGD
ncbi:glycine-rich protein [Brachybacterium paraconglomeratum]|uniref:glycine-rich protein n=1 Tax=Brachybacterium paraconglomeratum TaxID=173362 RepID=UPI003FD07918